MRKPNCSCNCHTSSQAISSSTGERNRKTLGRSGPRFPGVNLAEKPNTEHLRTYAKIVIRDYNKSKAKVGKKYVFKELLSAYLSITNSFYYDLTFKAEEVILKGAGADAKAKAKAKIKKFNAEFSRVYGVVSFKKIRGNTPGENIVDKHFEKQKPQRRWREPEPEEFEE